MKLPLKVLAALGHQEVDMRGENNFLYERMDDGRRLCAKLSAGCDLKVFNERLDGRPKE